jgi:hypothetical protein
MHKNKSKIAGVKNSIIDLSSNPFFLNRTKGDRSLKLQLRYDISYTAGEALRNSIISAHKPKSHFEETTLIEMYEHRICDPKTNMLGFLLLGLVIASGAAFVPFGVALDVSNPMTKVSWRVTNMIPFLAIVGIWQAKQTRHFNMLMIFERSTLISIMVAAFAISMQ